MHTRLACATIVFSLAAAMGAVSSPAAAQRFVEIPIAGAWAMDVSPDGEWVAGTAQGGGFRWQWRVDASPQAIPDGNVVAISDDGSVVAGSIDFGSSDQQAAIWTEATGWVGLGWLPNAGSCPGRSTAYDISGDGSTVVGLSWDGCTGRAFKWTAANGMEECEVVGVGSNRASIISTDGSVIGGWGRHAVSGRSPALWASDLTGDYYATDNLAGEILGLSHDGSTVMGTAWLGSPDNGNSAFFDDGSGLQNIGSINSGWSGLTMDMSENGEVAVGFDVQGLARQAWIWTPGDGMRSLQQFLTDEMWLSDIPAIEVAQNISDDGTVIVGGITPFSNDATGFIAEINTAWQDLGGGLAGWNNLTPEFRGSGFLEPFGDTEFTLSRARPFANAWLLLGVSTIYAPFKFGTMVPSPDVIIGGLTTSVTGEIEFGFLWPPDFPSGASLYWQYWISDSDGPVGFAASNGLSCTGP